jgi:hypothetical protein
MLACSIAISLLILLVILYLKDPSDFTGFPSLLLFITLFRLALNIATTRLILTNGSAGHIIEAFGNFVVGGNYVVGFVMFVILVVINFVVITKGAGRIAEVAARFTLDAMPGKQMAIDAELNAGMINEAEARARRKKVEQEADFYGAMDGASKFVRGDAVAAVLITLINVLGGFAIGIMQKGQSLTEALQKYTLLSIGDAHRLRGFRYPRHPRRRQGCARSGADQADDPLSPRAQDPRGHAPGVRAGAGIADVSVPAARDAGLVCRALSQGGREGGPFGPSHIQRRNFHGRSR